MDNFDLKKYLSNNPLLNEIKVNPPPSFSSKDIKALDVLIDSAGFGESSSTGYLDYPLGETYSLESYEPDDEEYLAIEHLLKKTPNESIYLIKDIFSFSDAPGAPKNAYYTRVTISKTDQEITIEAPHLNNNGGTYYMGWFGSDKNYYPDTLNFNEDGNYIGNAG